MGHAVIDFIRHDIRLQFRNGIYYAYGFVLAFYIAILVFGGDYIPPWAIGLIVYTDPAVLGFFFLGALMMLEKAEGTRSALAITPMPAMLYFWSKTITLTTLALLAAILIALVGKPDVNWSLYLSIVIFTSVTFIGLGFPIALKFKTVTGYLMGAAGFLTPILILMFLALYDPMPLWMMLIPQAAQFRLFLVSFGVFEASLFETGVMICVSAIAAFVFMLVGVGALKKEFGDK